MTDFSKLHFLENSLTVGSGTDEYEVSFYFNDEYIREDTWLQAASSVNWIEGFYVDYENGTLEFTVRENTDTASRQGKLYIRGKLLYEGDSYYSYIDDSMTIIQAGSVAGTGSISAQTGTTVIKAEGEQSSFEYTITNCDLSTLTITPDGNWSGDFRIDSYDENSCIYTATENSGTNARTISVQISAKMSDADEYAYAYVRLLQPSTNDVGYFLFPDGDTIQTDASAQSDIAYFEATHVSAITAVYSSEYYWLSGVSIGDEQYDHQDDILSADLEYALSANPYNFPRTGYLTIEGISTVDGSTVKGRLYFEQAANVSGVTQTAFLTCEEPYKALTSPDAQCDYFNFGRTNVNKNSVQIDSRNTYGNFESNPTLNRDTGVVNFCLNASTSTTEWTYSQIAVIGYSNDGHGNPANTLILTIAQPPYVDRLVFPIWQDTDVEIENRGEYVDYIITTGSTTIYSGRAYTLGGKCTVRLNTILENYLKPQLNVTVNGLQNKGAYLDATLKVFNGTEYQDYKRIYTYYDWSYKPQYSYIISKPIFKELDRRQLLLCSFYDNDGEMLGVDMELGNNDGTKQFYGYDFDNRIGTIVQDIYNTDSVYLIAGDRDEIEYKVKDTCKRYCLYYLNACGGWDSFLFENTSKETDNFTRSTYKKNINNQTHQFNKVEFKNAIVKSWTLKTCYLSDAQSLNLAENMIGSTCCYLHDFEANKIYPVLLTNKKTDYLTFNKNGRKMCRYDITAELAQDRKRT